MDRWSHLAEPYRSAAREAIARVAARSELSAPTCARSSREPWRTDMSQTHQPDAVPGRAAARARPHSRPAAAADRGRRARLQAHRDLGEQGRARRRAGHRAHRERAGRGAEEAGHHQQRRADRGQRMGRPPGGDGQRGDGHDPRRAQPLPAGRVPAAVRPARRLAATSTSTSASAPSSRCCARWATTTASVEDDFLQPGRFQAAAGYCVYGPQTSWC